MADLDDFFAKKDKKKSKKKLEESAKKVDDKPTKKKDRQPDQYEKDEIHVSAICINVFAMRVSQPATQFCESGF